MSYANVLIVEDDGTLGRLYNKVIKNQGHRTLHVHSVEEAMAAFFRFSPDVIWLDWQLRDTTSRAMLDFVYSLPPQQRPSVLLVSGHVSDHDLQDYQGLIDRVLTKPVRTQDATHSVNELAQDHAAHREPYGELLMEPTAYGGVMRVTMRGYVSVREVQKFAQHLSTSRGMILDLREVAASRLDLRSLQWGEMPIFTRMEAVVVVHNEDMTALAEMVPTLVGRDVAVHSFSDMKAALAFADTTF